MQICVKNALVFRLSQLQEFVGWNRPPPFVFACSGFLGQVLGCAHVSLQYVPTGYQQMAICSIRCSSCSYISCTQNKLIFHLPVRICRVLLAPLRWASLAIIAPSTATAKRIRLKAHLGNMAPTTGERSVGRFGQGLSPKILFNL